LTLRVALALALTLDLALHSCGVLQLIRHLSLGLKLGLRLDMGIGLSLRLRLSVGLSVSLSVSLSLGLSLWKVRMLRYELNRRWGLGTIGGLWWLCRSVDLACSDRRRRRSGCGCSCGLGLSSTLLRRFRFLLFGFLSSRFCSAQSSRLD
jgi:hypothetical protein